MGNQNVYRFIFIYAPKLKNDLKRTKVIQYYQLRKKIKHLVLYRYKGCGYCHKGQVPSKRHI